MHWGSSVAGHVHNHIAAEKNPRGNTERVIVLHNCDLDVDQTNNHTII